MDGGLWVDTVWSSRLLVSRAVEDVFLLFLLLDGLIGHPFRAAGPLTCLGAQMSRGSGGELERGFHKVYLCISIYITIYGYIYIYTLLKTHIYIYTYLQYTYIYIYILRVQMKSCRLFDCRRRTLFMDPRTVHGDRDHSHH